MTFMHARKLHRMEGALYLNLVITKAPSLLIYLLAFILAKTKRPIKRLISWRLHTSTLGVKLATLSAACYRTCISANFSFYESIKVI